MKELGTPQGVVRTFVTLPLPGNEKITYLVAKDQLFKCDKNMRPEKYEGSLVKVPLRVVERELGLE